jgi:hypothetical protein
MDIIERLKNCGPDWTMKHAGRIIPYEVCDDAAKEIAGLRLKALEDDGRLLTLEEANAALRAALEEIAKLQWPNNVGRAMDLARKALANEQSR